MGYVVVKKENPPGRDAKGILAEVSLLMGSGFEAHWKPPHKDVSQHPGFAD